MNVTIVGNELVIRLPLHEKKLSKTGQNFVIAGTGGVYTAPVTHGNMPVQINCSVWVKNPHHKKS